MFQHLVESLPRRVEAVIAAMFPQLVESLPRRVEVVTAAMIQHLVESLPRRVQAVIAAKGGTNSILMPMILERDSMFNEHIPYTFGHLVYVVELVIGSKDNSSFTEQAYSAHTAVHGPETIVGQMAKELSGVLKRYRTSSNLLQPSHCVFVGDCSCLCVFHQIGCFRFSLRSSRSLFLQCLH